MSPAPLTGMASACGIGLREIEQGGIGPAWRIAARFRADGAGLHLPPGCSAPGLDGWIEARRVEFVAGRVLALAALAALGLPGGIGRAASRAPVWPEGAGGAITHFGDRVAVLAGPASLRLGIDITEIPAPGRSFDAMTQAAVLDAEKPLLAAASLPPRQAETLIFSAKETLYKALAPEVGRVFGFDAAAAEALVPGTLTLRLTGELTPALPGGTRFDIPWQAGPAHVETRLIAPR